jgi:hypothetical protein
MMNWISSLLGKKHADADNREVPAILTPSEDKNAATGFAHMRRYPRFSVEGMDVRSKMMRAEPVRISNISVGGACIITSLPLTSGKKILITMNRNRVPHPLLGTVIWENKSGGTVLKDGVVSPVFRAGIQFKDVSSGTLVQLKDFMRGSGIPEETPHVKTDKQIALRYVITRDDGALLHYPTTYTIKKISMSGMLVEANHECEVGQRYPMALSLPNEKQPVNFIGRIASFYRLPGRDLLFDIGIEFLNLTEQGRTGLKRFIAGLLWKHEA